MCRKFPAPLKVLSVYVVVPVSRFAQGAQLTFAQLMTDRDAVAEEDRSILLQGLVDTSLAASFRFLKAAVLFRPCALMRLPSKGAVRHGYQSLHCAANITFASLSRSSRFCLRENSKVWQMHFAACNCHLSPTSLLQQQSSRAAAAAAAAAVMFVATETRRRNGLLPEVSWVCIHYSRHRPWCFLQYPLTYPENVSSCQQIPHTCLVTV